MANERSLPRIRRFRDRAVARLGEILLGKRSPKSEENCAHSHPVAPEVLSQYSAIRDPDAEHDIANYVHCETRDEAVQHIEKVKTEYVLGETYEVWDAHTDKGRWWVITNSTNLYSQSHFPSLDYTLSFHVGLMARLRSRSGPSADNPDPFDEVSRRREQASDRLDRAIEAEDYQAVGMQLRECLISVTAAMRRRTDVSSLAERPKDSDFKGWSDLLVGHLCPGNANKDLRSYLKTTAEKTWQLVSWLTHDRNANSLAASIALHACDT